MTDPTAAVADAPHRRRRAPRLPGLTVVLPCFNEAPNVAQAIQTVKPWAVDVSSGVEISNNPGIKDPLKIRDFIQAVRGTDAC